MKRPYQSVSNLITSLANGVKNVGPVQRKHHVSGVDHPQPRPLGSGHLDDSTWQDRGKLVPDGTLSLPSCKDPICLQSQHNGSSASASYPPAQGPPTGPLVVLGTSWLQNAPSGCHAQAQQRACGSGQEPMPALRNVPPQHVLGHGAPAHPLHAPVMPMEQRPQGTVAPQASQQTQPQHHHHHQQFAHHSQSAAGPRLGQRWQQQQRDGQASFSHPASCSQPSVGSGRPHQPAEPSYPQQAAHPRLPLQQRAETSSAGAAAPNRSVHIASQGPQIAAHVPCAVSFQGGGEPALSAASAPADPAAGVAPSSHILASTFKVVPQTGPSTLSHGAATESTMLQQQQGQQLHQQLLIMQQQHKHQQKQVWGASVGGAARHDARATALSSAGRSGSAPPLRPSDRACGSVTGDNATGNLCEHVPRGLNSGSSEGRPCGGMRDPHGSRAMRLGLPMARQQQQHQEQEQQQEQQQPQQRREQQEKYYRDMQFPRQQQQLPRQQQQKQLPPPQQPHPYQQQKQQQHHDALARELFQPFRKPGPLATDPTAEHCSSHPVSQPSLRHATASPPAAAYASVAPCVQEKAAAACVALAASSSTSVPWERADAPNKNTMPPVEKLKRPLRMALSEWIQHGGVVAAFEAKCVSKLYPWQAAALECGEDGHNLVYCAPTSGGKSLVAEVLMIRRLLAAMRARQQQLQQLQARGSRAAVAAVAVLLPVPRALLVLPYVSIVSEKTEHLTRVLAPLRGKVRGYTGAEQASAPLSAPDEMVAVVTMEKANSTVNRLMAEGRLGELCCVVVDEAHMVGDPHRGICLELCLTKLRFAATAAKANAAARSAAAVAAQPAPKAGVSSGAQTAAMSAATTAAATAGDGPAAAPFSCQLVCMSATMSGLDDMCGWLGARLFMTNFRPVPLTEFAVFKGKVFRKLTQQEMKQGAALMEQQQEQEGKQQAAGGKGTGTGACAAPGDRAPEDPASTAAQGPATGAASAAADAPASAKPRGTGSSFTTAAAAAAVPGTAASSATGGGSDGGAPTAVEPLVEERDLPEISSKDPDRVSVLVAEVAREGHSTLVFCATRSACQGCAGMLADLLPKQLLPVSADTFRARRALLSELQDASGGYLSPELQRLIEAGVAYHHAGLTSQERAAVERGFRGGLIHTLTATSTLAAGINLPARRVILRSLWQGIGPVSRAQYLQMIGRAGRAGQSPIGEAFLIGKGAPHTLQGEWRDVCRLMTARLPPLRCCLLDTPTSSEDGGDGVGPRKRPARAEGASAVNPASACGGKAAGAAAAGGGGTTGGGQPAQNKVDPAAGGAGETHLQRMLLEGIANGSVSTGATVEALIRSTLLYQQAGYEEIAAATHNALSALRQRRLVTFRPPTPKPAAATAEAAASSAAGSRAAAGHGGTGAGAGGAGAPQLAAAIAAAAGKEVVPSVASGGVPGALWQPTQMGRAIYDSCLPTANGQDLYDRLIRAQDGLAMEGGLHLLLLLLTEPLPLEVGSWEVWAAMLERMPREPHLRVAEALGVTTAYAQRLASGRRGNPEESARHSRFASACLMHELLCEGDTHELEQAWGSRGGLTKNGISRGQLQKLQSDLSKWAGMAAVMAASCGWWAMQALLEGLSQQAAAGARPELLPLMALPHMTGARARGLYAAGITKPALLAVASEEDVKKAIAASLPRGLRQPKPGKGPKDKEAAAAAAAAASSGNAVVARGARALVAAARQYLADLAARVAEEEADLAAAEVRANGIGGAGPADETGRAAARLAAMETATRLAAELRAAGGESAAAGATSAAGGGSAAAAVGSVAVGGLPATATSYRGSARITELSDASSPEALEAFLQAWRAQPSFALAVIGTSSLELEPEKQRLQQLQLGVVAPKAAGGADGTRPAAVDAAMTIPGPPRAAMAAARCTPPAPQTVCAAGGSGGGGNVDGDSVGLRRGGSCGSGGGGVGRLVEGLVVVWSHMEAVVLTFSTQSPPSKLAALVACGGDVGCGGSGGGLKRKAQAQPARRPKRGGTAAKQPPPLCGGAGAAKAEADEKSADRDADADAVAEDAATAAAAAAPASALWRAACEVLSAAGSSKVCWHAEAQVAALVAAGCEPAGQWDDPRVMAWLAQGITGPQDLSLLKLQRSLLPSYAVRVPLQHRAAATAACRAALVSWALAAPLRAMLAAEGVAAHYRLIEAPLTLALARTRLHLRSSTSSPQQPPHPSGGRVAPPPDVNAYDAAAATHPSSRREAVSHSPALTGAEKHDVSGAGAAPHGSCSIGSSSRGCANAGLVLDEGACRGELSRARAACAACAQLVSELLGRPVDLSFPAAVDALCGRESLGRRACGSLPAELLLSVPVGRRPPRADAFWVRAALPPRDRYRAAALALLLTRGAAAASMAAALEALLAVSARATPVRSCPSPRTDGRLDVEVWDADGDADMVCALEQQEAKLRKPADAAALTGCRASGGSGGPAGAPAVTAAAVAHFALHRIGVEGRLGCVFSADDDAAVATAPGELSGGGADGLVLLTELCSAPTPAPSLQQQYCCKPGGEQYLQGLLPLPVLFLDVAAEHEPPSYPNRHPGSSPGYHYHQPPPPPQQQPDPALLRPGLLLELQGPGPCMALSFGPDGQEEGAGSPNSRCDTAVVAATDPLTRQPLRLALPVSQVWCARSCCAADQAVGAARAGQLLRMVTPQVLRCPAEELLRPPPGGAFVTVLYPFLHLSVLAHCSGDERLVEALYQPQPWAAVAAAWLERQADKLQRLLQPRHAPSSSGGLCSPPFLELASQQVLSRALLAGCSHRELAAALGLGAGGGKVAAAALVSSFLEAFPGVAHYREELLTKAKKAGYVPLPSGQRLRPATRQLTAGGVAAGAKLQRVLCRMQLSATAAAVVRTAAALALQRIQAAAGDAAPAASLVWCGEAQAALCVPQRRLAAALREVQGAASAGVMGHLGLRVPLHLSIYHGCSLELLRCEQFIPGGDGGDDDGRGGGEEGQGGDNGGGRCGRE